MLIFGRNAIMEMMSANKAVYKMWFASNLLNYTRNPVFNLAKKKGVKIEYVNKNELDKLSQGGIHQGFVAEVEDFQYSSVDEILQYAQEKFEQPFVVLLDKVEDPHNLGSVIRVCECAGVHGVIIPKHHACQVNETVAKTSAGALSHMKIAKVTNLNQVIDELKKQGMWIYAVELGGTDFYKQNLTGSLGLVIGSEGYGISQLTKKHCDGILTLPMCGKVNSLNASVACGVAVFEALRQRRK
ncbi:MAG: 23S rRNA (guanosine(2251)-2'-O)-methyltransferase RlmB [Clostridia bacterium]|nr:23S rRNA (guanosine(2251)-2'-O)-methyltransferase RlmB [Clostridia bacterium]